MKTNHPEIRELQEFADRYQVRIQRRSGQLNGLSWYPAVHLWIAGLEFDLYVDDEYGDLREGNQLLCLNLVLRELEAYKESEDLLQWCRWKHLDPVAPDCLAYYQRLDLISSTILEKTGPIQSPIADMEWELNAGAAQALRSLDASESG